MRLSLHDEATGSFAFDEETGLHEERIVLGDDTGRLRKFSEGSHLSAYEKLLELLDALDDRLASVAE